MKPFFAIILAFSLAGCVSSERTIFLKAPPIAMRDSIDIAWYEREYGKYDGVYLDIDENIEHSGTTGDRFGGQTWDYNYVVRRKYLVLNPDAEYLTTFNLRAHRLASIGTLYLQVTSPAGKTTRYGIKDLIQEAASKNYLKYKFIYPNIVKGSIVEEGFELSYDGFDLTPPLQHEIPLQFQIPCQRVSFTYAVPDWWEVRAKRIGVNDSIPYTLVLDPIHHKKIISCSSTRIGAVKDEPYDPYFKEMAKYFEFRVTSFSMGKTWYKSPKSWGELISRIGERLTKREGAGVFSSRVTDLTDDLTVNRKTQLDKLTTIMDYVQSKIEIVDDGVDRDFADALKDNKGDPYTVAGLTNMMFRKAGLPSELLLVHSAKEGYFDSTYYSFDQLSIPAVDVRADGSEFIVLPYRKDIPYDHIPEYLQGQTAIVVSDASEQAKIITIPSGSRTKNSIVEKFDLTIGDDGMITVDEVKTIQGSYAYYLREYLSGVKQTERDKFFNGLISYSEGQVKISTCVLDNEKEYKKPLVLHYTYAIDNLVTLTPDEVLFHTAGLFAPTSLKSMRLESEERNNPIRVYYDEEYVKDISIRYPGKWEMKTTLDSVTIENTFGTLKMHAEKNGNTLTVKQQRFLKRSAEPKEKIAEFAKLTGSKKSTVLPTIVFKKML